MKLWWILLITTFAFNCRHGISCSYTSFFSPHRCWFQWLCPHWIFWRKKKQILLSRVWAWTNGYLCGVSEFFTLQYQWYDQSSEYFSRICLLDLERRIPGIMHMVLSLICCLMVYDQSICPYRPVTRPSIIPHHYDKTKTNHKLTVRIYYMLYFRRYKRWQQTRDQQRRAMSNQMLMWQYGHHKHWVVQLADVAIWPPAVVDNSSLLQYGSSVDSYFVGSHWS